jgi:hypothetical protein
MEKYDLIRQVTEGYRLSAIFVGNVVDTPYRQKLKKEYHNRLALTYMYAEIGVEPYVL